MSFVTCITTDCGKPEHFVNGHLTHTVTTLGSVVEYRCAEGFYIVGSATRSCRLTEENRVQWIPKAPECKVQGMPKYELNFDPRSDSLTPLAHIQYLIACTICQMNTLLIELMLIAFTC